MLLLKHYSKSLVFGLFYTKDLSLVTVGGMAIGLMMHSLCDVSIKGT